MRNSLIAGVAANAVVSRISTAWLVMSVLGALLVLNMLFLIFVGGGSDPLEAGTQASPAAAIADLESRIVAQERTLAIGYLGFALFATAIAYGPYRDGSRWAWNAMWILPGILGVTAASMFISGSIGIGAFYAAFAAAVTVVQLFGRGGIVDST